MLGYRGHDSESMTTERHPSDRAPVRVDCLKVFAAIFFCYALTFSCLVWRMHFSSDSYIQVYRMDDFWHLSLGRFMNYLYTVVIGSLGLNTVADQRIFLCIWIVAMSGATLVLEETFARFLGNRATLVHRMMLALVAMIAYLNVFNLELILFPEMATFMASAMLCVSGAVWFFLHGRGWMRFLSIPLLFIALGSYQSLIGSFVAFTLAGILCRLWADGDVRKAVISSLTCGVVAVVESVGNIAFLKLLIARGVAWDTGRGANFALSNILSNTRAILEYQVGLLLSADGLLPGPWFLAYAIVLVTLLVVVCAKTTIGQRVVLVLALLVSVLFAFAAHFIEQHIDLTPRSNIAVWATLAAFGCFAMVSLMRMTEKLTPLRRTSTAAGQTNAIAVLGITTVVFLLINGLAIQDIAQDTFVSNYEDRRIAEMVGAELDAYEARTGVEVTHIAKTNDQDPVYVYPEIRYVDSQLGIRSLVVSYNTGYKDLINYATGRHLEAVEMPEDVYAEHFAGKNWQGLDLDEQLVIIGDTAYLAVY